MGAVIGSGTADRSFPFDDLCAILRRLGFDARRGAGSHRIFVRKGIAEILNLQPRADGQAKPYQVRQVRDVLVSYGLVAQRPQERDDEA